MVNKIWSYNSNEDDKLAKQVEKDNTIVMTKESMAIDLISLINFKDGDVIMEPCKGSGSFYNNLPTNTENVYCEINEGLDYLTQNKIVDYTLSNPPFVPRKLFWLFNCKAMQTTRKDIYWLVNMSSLNVFTPKRLEEMKDRGWFINSLHIVSDKRWFGRYVWIKITKEDKKLMSWKMKSY